jgi:hypothetical protein
MSNYYKNNKNMFPTTEIQCCRFHLGQSWWRKVQKLGLSKEYKEKDCDIGKWLASFIGLAEPRCSLLADYILKNYVASNSKFPPNLWVQLPSLDSKRTTNAAESFHAHYNEQFYAAHPTILAFLDVITKIQITTYIKIRTLHQPAVVRRSEMDKLTFLMEQYAKYQNGEIHKSYRLQIFDQNRCLTSLQRESDSVLRSFILFIMPVLLLYIKTISCAKSYFQLPVVCRGNINYL